jgi:TonB family protein
MPAQTPAPTLDHLHTVIAETSLDAPGVKPWHLKMDVELNSASTLPGEKGTVEEWWAGPNHYRRVYTFPSYAGTEVRTEDGFYRTPGSGSAPYDAEAMMQLALHPMAAAEEVNAATLDTRKESFGKLDFDCVMLTQPIKNVAYPPLGLFPTYCFDRPAARLRMISEYPGQVLALDQLGVFRGLSVAVKTRLLVYGRERANSHVTVLQGREQPYPDTDDLTGVEKKTATTARVAGSVIAGGIVDKVPPVYPQAAKDHHSEGTVVLRAIIGRDGHIRSLRPKSFPDPDLVIAAIAAVRQWTYKPYLLNGEPTEVDTTITVNFKLGPPV